MKKKISITISIPTFNEEQTLESVVRKALHVLRSLTEDYEPLLINNGSIDSTGKIMNRLARKDKHIRVIHHKENMGFNQYI